MNLELSPSPSYVTYEQISVRAYYLWEKAGRPLSEDFWLEAEKELLCEADAARPAWEKLPEAFCSLK